MNNRTTHPPTVSVRHILGNLTTSANEIAERRTHERNLWEEKSFFIFDGGEAVDDAPRLLIGRSAKPRPLFGLMQESSSSFFIR